MEEEEEEEREDLSMLESRRFPRKEEEKLELRIPFSPALSPQNGLEKEGDPPRVVNSAESPAGFTAPDRRTITTPPNPTHGRCCPVRGGFDLRSREKRGGKKVSSRPHGELERNSE